MPKFAGEPLTAIELKHRFENELRKQINAYLEASKLTQETFYYARAGQYGEDLEVLCINAIGHPIWWNLDPSKTFALYPCADQDLLLAEARKAGPKTFCIFQIQAKKVWTIQPNKEVAIITFKDLKNG